MSDRLLGLLLISTLVACSSETRSEGGDATSEVDVFAEASGDTDTADAEMDSGAEDDRGTCVLDCGCGGTCYDGVITQYGVGGAWQGPCDEVPICPGQTTYACPGECALDPPDSTCGLAIAGEAAMIDALCAPPAPDPDVIEQTCAVDCGCGAVCRDGVVTVEGDGGGWNGPCSEQRECPAPYTFECPGGCAFFPPANACQAAVDAAFGDTSSLCAPVLDACAPLIGDGTSREDLAYGEHPRQILDLYLPLVVDRDLPPPPLFVWIHGGGWRGGTHDSLPQQVRDLVRRRIAVASVEYRFSDTPFPTTTHDVREAIRWLRREANTYGYDGSLIGVGGSSAGGHLAAMLGVASEVEALDLEPGLPAPSVSVVVDFFGPSDLLEMDGDSEINGCGEGALCHDCEGSPETLLVDCESTLSTCADVATLASPVTHVTADDPPFVILHGDEDCTVATPQGVRLHDALLAARVESTLYITEGAGHGVGDVGDAGAWALVHETLERELLDCVRDADEEVVPDELSPCAFAECPPEAEACSLSEDCIDLDACIGECLGTMGCIPSCVAGVSTEDVATHRALFDCADAAGCYGR